MGLRGYITKRIIYSLILVFFVITLNFMIFQLMPGNPLEFFMSPGKIRDPKQIEQLEELWGLHEPIHIKYIKYVKAMLTFNFGLSNRPPNKPIYDMIMESLPNTLLLMGVAEVLSIVIGVILGVLAAYKRGGIFDSTAVVASLTTYSLPVFWMGMIFLIAFAYYLGWFPLGHTISNITFQPFQVNIFGTIVQIPFLAEIPDRLWHLFLPALTLTLFMYGNYLLLTRATMIEALTEDYVTTARAKGLKERTIIFKHALKNASLPIITSAAISFGFMFSGAIITETVFAWPGIGTLTWKAISLYDYPVLHVVFYVSALLVIIANFIADLLYGIIDPRVKYG